MKVLIYALGGGWGHITRAVSLTNAFDAGDVVTIVANSPHLPVIQTALPRVSIQSVLNSGDVSVSIRENQPDVLVVDTFPRGLVGELVPVLRDVKALKVLVHRDIRPEYVSWASLREFVSVHYHAVICPGELGPLSDLPQCISTPPWIVRPPKVIDTPAQILVIAAGEKEELDWYGEVMRLLATRTDVRCLAPELPPNCPHELWLSYWPAIDWIANARVVVGSAGYNTMNECRALGIPLIARPFARKYDRQLHRAQQSPNVAIVESPQDAVCATMKVLENPQVTKPVFHNGAIDAVRFIRTLIADSEKFARRMMIL